MIDKDIVILKKILSYINDVEQYITNYNIELFFKDKKTMAACAFAVSQIGELAKEISEDTQERYDYIPWRSIKGMRNKIVHDYENIDLVVLWGTIDESLPTFGMQISDMLLTYENNRDVLNNSEEDECEL